MDYRQVVQTALNEVGYQGEEKSSKYQKFLDSIQWYNGAKNGACTWCTSMVDYCFAINNGNLTYEQVRQIVCEPADHRYNTGAGAVQHAQMFKDAGQWISKVSQSTTGDYVFFKNDSGIYHVGLIVNWDSKGIYTVEGSTTYNGKPHSTGKKFYSYSSPKLAGFGRPRWFMFDTQPDPDPVEKKYRVNVKDFLAVRTKPSTDATKVGELYGGAIVSISETSGGWARITGDSWVSMKYLVLI